jgi:hypothetical protein
MINSFSIFSAIKAIAAPIRADYFTHQIGFCADECLMLWLIFCPIKNLAKKPILPKTKVIIEQLIY